jgi:hypothetical protein
VSAYPHANSRVYTSVMTTPILTAAAARQSRRNPCAATGGKGKISPHNYIAEGWKKPVGAPLGNRNAARRSFETVERQSRIEALFQQTMALAHAADAAVAQARAERQVLAVLLAEAPNV